MRFEEITLSLPKTEDLFGYIEANLSGYGLTLSEGGRNLLFSTIEKLRKNKNFDGFKSIKLLCQDIAYSFFFHVKSSSGLFFPFYLKNRQAHRLALYFIPYSAPRTYGIELYKSAAVEIAVPNVCTFAIALFYDYSGASFKRAIPYVLNGCGHVIPPQLR
jgi:hypothetical protein